MFTDSYGEQSCTAGRSSFITGQSVLSHRPLQGRHSRRADRHDREDRHDRRSCSRTRATRPGSSARTISATSTSMLPTNHGFDEFFGNLYHLNAEEEPEMYDYPPEKDFPNFRKKFGPRGVIHSWATDKDDPTEEPRWGKVGKQKIEDTGPLNQEAHGDLRRRVRRRRQGLHQARRTRPASRSSCGSTPRTCTSFTHTKKESLGQAGRWQSPYHDTMIDHDKNVGQMLDLLDELGIADEHLRDVLDRQRPAPELLAGRRHDAVPQREEHQLGRRLPRSAAGALARQDQGRARSRTRSCSTTTGCRPSSRWRASPTSSRSCKKGYKAIGRTYKNHIDGYNLLPYLTGKEKESPRKLFVYFSDDGDVLGAALRQLEGRVHGAALPGHDAGLGRAVHAAAAAEALQPAHRSLRVRRHHVEHLLRLVHPPRLHHLRRVRRSPTSSPRRSRTSRRSRSRTRFTIDDAMAKMQEAAAGG